MIIYQMKLDNQMVRGRAAISVTSGTRTNLIDCKAMSPLVKELRNTGLEAQLRLMMIVKVKD